MKILEQSEQRKCSANIRCFEVSHFLKDRFLITSRTIQEMLQHTTKFHEIQVFAQGERKIVLPVLRNALTLKSLGNFRAGESH
jgi:hypothetical protein